MATNAFRVETERYEIPKKLLYRTFERESGFELWARHPGSNCRGPGQISEILAWEAFLSGKFRDMHLFSKYPAPNPSTGKIRRSRRRFIHPKTGKEYHINKWSVYHPPHNIRLSAWMLRTMFDVFGSWRLALIAYNAGPRTLQDIIFADSYAAFILEEEPHYETRDYLRFPRRRRKRR